MRTDEALDVIADLVPQETSFVCSLGRTAEIAFRRIPSNTLFLDSMGDVASVAVGVSLGLPRDRLVVALDTDGSHLMGLTLLPTLAAISKKLTNLVLVVFDNAIYESAGGLASRFCDIDWSLLGGAFGLPVVVVSEPGDLRESMAPPFDEFRYVVARVENPVPLEEATKSVDGIESKYLFVRHLETILGRKILRPAIKN